MTKLFTADCYFKDEYYNHRIRATVPPSWVIDFDCALPHLAHAGTQLFILMEHAAYNQNKDDRFVRGQA